MSDSKILHFTLGPVQGFVAQARRTRDLWGGSFLLSWLAGHAMKAVLDSNGKIIFPIVHDAECKPTDPLLNAILNNGKGQPRIGTLPNRFKAQVPNDFNPELCTEAIQSAWAKVCQAVWNTYIEGVASQETSAIWKRQTERFWEIAWVCDTDPGDSTDGAWLDSRKNLRNHRPPDEGGDHCMVMGDWQELSGFVRFRDRERQDGFWRKLRSQNCIGKLDLRDGERLCAIAIVKRLFPKVAQQAIGWQMNIRNWPSTSYMAAIPWILKAWKTDKTACQAYAVQVQAAFAGSASGERNTRIECLDEVSRIDPNFNGFSGLDGNAFQAHALANEKLTPLKGAAEDETRRNLLTALATLKKNTCVPLTPYYAMLIMDGDSMGAQLRKHPFEVSTGLAKFTDGVEPIVSANNGVTIYAGGDDVLAMFPLDYAITAAHKLRSAYQNAFDKAPWASISAAIIYAHHHQPLRSVLKQAHRQLDKVAKEQNDRDSLALCVLKGGDISSSWVGCWEPRTGYFPAIELANMAEEFSLDTQFSSRFLYVLRDRLNELMNHDGQVVHGIDIIQVLQAEYLRNRELTNEPDLVGKAKIQVENLIEAINRYLGHADISVQTSTTVLQPEGPILLRFLALKGVDE